MSKRFIGFMNTKKGTAEILPKAFGLRCVADRRRLVLEMANSYLPEAARFNALDKAACSAFDLPALCGRKLLELSEAEGSMEPLRRFSALFSHGGRFELRLNLDDAFLRLVHRRILLKQPAETVTMHRDHIAIDNGTRTLIRPVWKHTGAGDGIQHRHLIREGIQRFKATDHDQLYLVYPKNDGFTRHIPVRNTGGDAGTDRMLKLIPYSFSFCSRSQKKGKKRCAG